MGDLKTLPSWTVYFNNIQGSELSTMTNNQKIGSLCVVTRLASIGDRFSRLCSMGLGYSSN